jgi:hypothetical protein
MFSIGFLVNELVIPTTSSIPHEHEEGSICRFFGFAISIPTQSPFLVTSFVLVDSLLLD